MERVCCVDGCDRPSRARMLCSRHYQRYARYGDPLIPPQPSHLPAERRFWDKVNVLGAQECWEWTGTTNSYGYGYFRGKVGQAVSAHRFSAELHLPDYDEALWVLHHCDNPPCVNPAHLYMGTAADNSRDMVKRGRSRNQYVDADACAAGHPYVDGSYYQRRDRNERVCRVCAAERHERVKQDPERRAKQLAYFREYKRRRSSDCAPDDHDLTPI